jgi:hypothetical protein
VTVANGARLTTTVPSPAVSGAPRVSSMRSVDQAASIPPAIASRAVAARPSVSRSRTVTRFPSGVPGRPAARGLPNGLSAESVTFGAPSTSNPASDGAPPAGPFDTTATRSWL